MFHLSLIAAIFVSYADEDDRTINTSSFLSLFELFKFEFSVLDLNPTCLFHFFKFNQNSLFKGMKFPKIPRNDIRLASCPKYDKKEKSRV
jgi:hypothetical protein